MSPTASSVTSPPGVVGADDQAVGPCPDDDVLQGYAEGLLQTAAAAGLEHHVDQCGRCRDALRLFALVTASPVSPTATAPDLPDRYRLVESLGEGGQGTVWRAVDTQLGRDVALKLVHCPDARHRESLQAEARALAALSHPNVLEIFDIDLSGDPGFLAMPVCRESLADNIDRGTDWKTAVRLMLDVVSGLIAVHGAGLVHRDIKPANLLRDNTGAVVIGDFGIVSMGSADTSEPNPNPARSQDTSLTTLCGTPAYLAPEVWQGHPHSPTSDQYAFFVSLAQLVTGILPRRNSRWTGSAGVPKWLRRVVRRGLSPNPRARFPSMAAVERALQQPRNVRAFVPWLAVAAGSVAAVAFGGVPTTPPSLDVATVTCTPSVPEPWTDDMATAVAESGHPRATQWSQTMSARIQEFGEGVSQASKHACQLERYEAHRCLGRLQERVDAMTRRLAKGEVTASGVDRLQRLLPELTSFEHCLQVEERVGASPLEPTAARGQASLAVHGAYAAGLLRAEPGFARQTVAQALADGLLADHPDLHATALRRSASSAIAEGRAGLEEQHALLAAAEQRALDGDAPAVQAAVWTERANIAHAMQADADRALEFLDFADAAIIRAGSPAPGRMRSALVRAKILLSRGDTHGAKQHADSAEQLARSIGAASFRALALMVIGKTLLAEGRDGVAVMEEAVQLMRETHAVPGANFDEAVLKLAAAYRETEQPLRSLAVVQPVVRRLVETHPGSTSLAYALNVQGLAALEAVWEEENPTDASAAPLHALASDSFERALAIQTSLGSAYGQGIVESSRGRLALEQDRHADAETHYLAAIEHLEQVLEPNDPNLANMRAAIAFARAERERKEPQTETNR
ncbi:MAG: protein kinase domain-containing protein [Nannocystales bacterium]